MCMIRAGQTYTHNTCAWSELDRHIHRTHVHDQSWTDIYKEHMCMIRAGQTYTQNTCAWSELDRHIHRTHVHDQSWTDSVIHCGKLFNTPSSWAQVRNTQYNSTYPEALYPDRLCISGKFVENYTKLTCLDVTGYRINYNTVLWPLELQIRRGRKVSTQVHTINSNSRTSNCQCSLFSKINPIIRIFCIFGSLAVPFNPDKWILL
jgi:hypothetical protein